MRLHATCLLAHLLAALAVSGAAPVPKGPPPPQPLTADRLVGYWNYEWGSWPSGYICFDKDGTYCAVHDPAAGTTYAGTWRLAGNTVTITEYSFDAATGERRGGPCDYAFDFGKTAPPNLSGTSNGSTRVALSDPKR